MLVTGLIVFALALLFVIFGVFFNCSLLDCALFRYAQVFGEVLTFTEVCSFCWRIYKPRLRCKIVTKP